MEHTRWNAADLHLTTPTPSDDTVNLLADYNLCVPASSFQGPHGLSTDPGFVDRGVYFYWLREDSPARGRGTAKFAPQTDFWGRTIAKDKAPDLGAFSYCRHWASNKAFHSPQNRWTYRFAPSIDMDLDDLWYLPEDEKQMK